MKTGTMDVAARAAYCNAVRRVLGEPTPLERWAREMDAGKSPLGDRLHVCSEWCGAGTLEALIDSLRPALRFEPDLTLLTRDEGSERQVYMKRWWLTRSVAADASGGEHGLYLHAFWHDDPAGLHNHPWASASLLIAGRLRDHTEGESFTDVSAGGVMLRPAAYRHRLTILGEPEGDNPRALSLIATGRRRREGWEIRHADGTREHIPKGNTDGRPETYSRGHRPRA